MRQFTLEDRRVLCGMLTNKQLGYKEIAVKLGFSTKTIKRELKRGDLNGNYAPIKAQEVVDQGRINNAKARIKLLQDNGYLEEIEKLLDPGIQSPDSIAGRKKLEKKAFVCTKTIYRYIWHYNEGLRKKLAYQKRYKKHHSRQGKRPEGYRHISTRTKEANDRIEIGHTEIDLVMSKGNKAGLMTLVDRKSRFGLMLHVKDKQITTINSTLILMVSDKEIQKKLKTITSDNGREFFGLKHIEKILGFEQYYADPYSSYQRGTNEQYNRQIRKIFPKGTDFNLVAPETIKNLQQKLNRKPRKCLGYLTPEEAFYGTTIKN